MSIKNKKLILIALVLVIAAGAYVSAQIGTAPGGHKTKPVQNDAIAADAGSAQTNPEHQFNNSVTWSLLKLLGALVLVVAGIYGFVYILRKMMGRKFSGNRGNDLIEVLETTYIEQKKSLSLVRFHDRAVLIGTADSGINVLAELDAEQTARILSECATQKTNPGFGNILKDAKTRMMSLGMGMRKAEKESVKTERPQTV